jgi:tetratricopeptide (TPR) repeat protein
MAFSYRSVLIAAAATFCGTSAAHAATDDLVRQAVGLDHDGHPDQAYAMLNAHLAERAADPDFNYALGLAAIDSGRVAESILAFQRVLAVQPGNAEARAELAKAYALSGDVDTARAQFDTVLQDPSLPDPVRQRFTQFSKTFTKQINGGGSDVTGFVDASGGYDSNINTATDLSSVTIPLFAAFGPGALSGNARASDDQYIEGQAGLSGVTAISRQDRVFGSVLGSYHGNFGTAAFNQANATGTFGLAHSFANRDTVSLSGQVQQFWLGDKSYRQAVGAIGQYTHALSGGRALSASAQFFRFNYDNQPLLDANRYAFALSYAERKFVLSGSMGKEQTRQIAGDNQSNWFGDGSIAAELPISNKAAFVGGAGFDLRRYDAPDPLFLMKRHDERVDVSAGIKLAVAKNLTVRPRVIYTRNFSNIAIYDFKRVTASVGVRFEF